MAQKAKEQLTEEQVREFAANRLKRLIRGLEKAFLIEPEIATKLVGDVLKLEAMAKGEFKLREK